jgi:iron complex outermembrane receptor protein
MTNKLVKGALFGTTMLVAVPFCVSHAVAQGETASAGSEEIVVTARSRQEKLKDVPISITALSGATLDKLDLQDTSSIAAFTPSVVLPTMTPGFFPGRLGNSPLIFRGLNLTSNSGYNAASLVFLDGAPLIGENVPAGLDTARVEVLRGPQSVYFGRSTMTGAINYVSKDPSPYWQGDFQVKVGTYETKDIQAAVSGPVIEDQLDVGVALQTKSNGGFDENAGNPGEKLGAQSTNSVVGTFDWRPIDGLSIKGFANWFRDSDGPAEEAVLHVHNDNCNLGGTANFYCGTFPTFSQLGAYVNDQVSPQAAKYVWNGPIFPPGEFSPQYGNQRHALLAHGIVSYDIGDFAVAEARVSFEHDMDIGAYDSVLESQTSPYVIGTKPGALPNNDRLYNFAYGDNTIDITYEARLRSAGDGPFQWTLGTTFVRGDDQQGAGLITESNAQAFAGTGPVAFFFPFGTTFARTYGIYGGGTYDITDALSLSFEARYQWDERTARAAGGNISTEFKSFNPRTSISYKITPDLTAYASYATGSRPGGFNTQELSPPYNNPVVLAAASAIIGPINVSYKEENLKMYEVGVKGDLFDNRLNFDVDGYDGELDNMQIANGVFLPPSILANEISATTNIGQVDLWGAEAQAGIKVSDQLTFQGTFAWNHTNIVKYLCYSCVQITGSTKSPIGKPLGSAPEYSGSLQADYRDKLLQTDWDWYGHVDYVYRGSEPITNYTSQATLVARNVVNLRAGVDNGSITVEGYITNVTNDRNYDGGNWQNDFAEGGASGFNLSVPPPRIYGARVKYRFGGAAPASGPAPYTPPAVQAPMPAPKMATSYMVFFDFNKADLTSQAVSIVDTAAANAMSMKVTQLVVTGHTDTVGSDAYNMRLSRRRAESVAAELEKKGVPASEIEIVAKGKHDLLVPTKDGVKEPQNRRVQIVYSGAGA